MLLDTHTGKLGPGQSLEPRWEDSTFPRWLKWLKEYPPRNRRDDEDIDTKLKVLVTRICDVETRMIYHGSINCEDSGSDDPSYLYDQIEVMNRDNGALLPEVGSVSEEGYVSLDMEPEIVRSRSDRNEYCIHLHIKWWAEGESKDDVSDDELLVFLERYVFVSSL